MTRIAVVQGASRGLGLELARQLQPRFDRVVATCRDPDGADALSELDVDVLHLDVTEEGSIVAAAEAVKKRYGQVGLLVNAAGVLHRVDGVQPEKKLAHVTPAALEEVFRVNAFGPLLVAKHFHRLLTDHRGHAVLANVSARVGSIEDNRLGGWYAYRASKAAQNMMTRNLAVELGRLSPAVVVLAYHPGTVNTDLSAPFQRGVKPGKLFPVERGAGHLVELLEGANREEHHGGFFAWDGSPIPW